MSREDAEPTMGGFDGGGFCEPELSDTVPLCVVDAAVVDGMDPDTGAEDAGAVDAGAEDADAVDAGADDAGVPTDLALGARLADLGAPPTLVAACGTAAEDERRHTRSIRALARRYGDDLRPWRAPVGATPTLSELAVENRVEGCVRETFGAAVAAYQAQRAGDPSIARVMATVAREEAEHARLGWQVAAWLEDQLDPEARAAVQAAADAAVAVLNVPSLGPADAARAGLPDAAAAQAIRRALEPLWASAPAEVLAQA